MSSFVPGLVLGAILGAAATYLALEKPWAGDREVVATAAHDAGIDDSADSQKTAKRGKRKRGKRTKGESEAELQEIDERVVLTAADRTMQWRGPAIAAPDSAVNFGEEGGGRRLDDSEIHAGVSGAQREMVSCIADARGQAELAAKITLKLLVSDSGKVSKVRMQAPSYLLKNGLFECASGAARRMRFPATGAQTLVTVPFELSF